MDSVAERITLICHIKGANAGGGAPILGGTS